MKSNDCGVALIQYIRSKGQLVQDIDTGEVFREKGAPRGVLVADQVGNEVKIGWSMTHENDKFNKKRGLNIAKTRMDKPCSEDMIPHTVKKEMAIFRERALKYFKILA
jgi:hypothetical protein